VPAVSITLDEALDLVRTGDVWLFRGRKAADRAIQVATNSPVNHVGMSVVIDDLPPLMWHAELSRSLPDLWSGTRHRGVQLHDLRQAVIVWSTRYGQQAWLRQLDHPVTGEMEDAALRTIARMDGTPFPSTARLVSRWLSGRVPAVRRQTADADLETAYCAEVLAVTYRAMGLLPGRHRLSWYDAGRFWSGDDLRLSAGVMLGGEIAVHVPPGLPHSSAVGGLPAREPVGDGADDGVGAGAQDGGQEQSALVLQDPVTPPAGLDLGDEDGDLPAGLLCAPDVADDRMDQ
jgi:hypothetical protein